MQNGQVLTIVNNTGSFVGPNNNWRFLVNGALNTVIHTSCSVPILGLKFGDFFVAGFVTPEGNENSMFEEACCEATANILAAPNPSVSITPNNATVCVGGTATLTANTSGGTGTCTIQWQSGPSATGPWTDIANANAATYNAPTATAGTTYYRATYTCTGGGCDAAASNVSEITVTPDPSISITPNNATVCVGGTAMLTANTSGGTGTCTIQWQRSLSATGPWTDIAAANSTTYNAPTTTAGTTYYRATYTCTGGGCDAAASNVSEVIVTPDPSISIAPDNATVCVGGTAMLTANTSGGTGTCTIQWQRSLSATGPWTDIAVANSTTYNAPTTIDRHTAGVALRFRDAEDMTAGATFMLHQNYPNPVKYTTTIGFELPYDGTAALVFHDVSGRVLARVAGDFAKGHNQVVMDGGFPDGLVYYTLTMDGYTATKRMIVIAD